MEPQAQLMGGVGIFDLEGLTMNHTLHMSPTVAQKMIAIMVVRELILSLIFKFQIFFSRLHCLIVQLQFIL